MTGTNLLQEQQEQHSGVEVLARSVLEYVQASPPAFPLHSESMVAAKYIGG